jgi:hypothetical protein
MALSDLQIERYSRQIIVPEFGALAQERLLASRLTLAGELDHVEAALAYLVGAGVGEIGLYAPRAPKRVARLIAEMKALNPEVKVASVADPRRAADLAMVVATGAAGLAAARAFARRPREHPLIVARLHSPSAIAVIPKAPPCPACAAGGLLGAFASPSNTAGFITMVATVEALKILAGHPPPTPVIFEFDGYESRAATIVASPGCACSGAARKSSR